MKGPRRADVESSRSTILQAAEELFLERGYAGTSMSEIAKASGVTKSLIHHHFGSKEALWKAVKRVSFEAFHAKQKELVTAQPLSAEAAQASMRIYFEFLAENPRVLRMMWWILLGEGDDRQNELVVELAELWVAQIETLQAHGAVRDDLRPESILSSFLGVVHAAFTEEWLLAARGISMQDYIEDAWELFAHGAMRDGFSS